MNPPCFSRNVSNTDTVPAGTSCSVLVTFIPPGEEFASPSSHASISSITPERRLESAGRRITSENVQHSVGDLRNTVAEIVALPRVAARAKLPYPR